MVFGPGFFYFFFRELQINYWILAQTAQQCLEGLI